MDKQRKTDADRGESACKQAPAATKERRAASSDTQSSNSRCVPPPLPYCWADPDLNPSWTPDPRSAQTRLNSCATRVFRYVKPARIGTWLVGRCGDPDDACLSVFLGTCRPREVTAQKSACQGPVPCFHRLSLTTPPRPRRRPAGERAPHGGPRQENDASSKRRILGF